MASLGNNSSSGLPWIAVNVLGKAEDLHGNGWSEGQHAGANATVASLLRGHSKADSGSQSNVQETGLLWPLQAHNCQARHFDSFWPGLLNNEVQARVGLLEVLLTRRGRLEESLEWQEPEPPNALVVACF